MQSGECIVINGRNYQLGTVLSTGAGSYGQVWAATDAGGYPVALKVINTLAMAQADPSLRGHWRAHLEREIAFLAELDSEQSRHIVTLLDHGQINGQPVLVMEQLSGNLGQWLAQQRQENASPLELARILDWAGQILSGLEVIHHAGFVYRDLKFSNILVNQDGTLLKLADFGSLKRQDNDSTRSFIGTPATMAPEQVLPAYISPKGYEYVVTPCADYYALGLLLFTLLTAQPATAAQRRLGQLLAQYGQEGAARYSEQLGGLDDEEQELLQRSIEFWTVPVSTQPGNGTAALLTDLIIRLLARDPADRPRNSIEIRTVLDAVRAGQLMAFTHESKPAAATNVPDWDISSLTLPPNPHLHHRPATVARSRYSRQPLALFAGILGLAGALAWAIILRPVADESQQSHPRAVQSAASNQWSASSANALQPVHSGVPDDVTAAIPHEPLLPAHANTTPVDDVSLPVSEPISTLVNEPVEKQNLIDTSKPDRNAESKSLAEPSTNITSQALSPPESPPIAPAIAKKPPSKPAPPVESEPQITRRSPPATAKTTPPKPRQEKTSRTTVYTHQTVKAAPARAVARVEPRLQSTPPPPALPPIELKSRSQPTPLNLPPIELKSRSQPTPPALPPINLVSRADPATVATPIRASRRAAPASPSAARAPRYSSKPTPRSASQPRKPFHQITDPIAQFQKDASRAAIGIRRDIKVLTNSVGTEVQRGLESVQQTLTYNNSNPAQVERRDRQPRRYSGPPSTLPR